MFFWAAICSLGKKQIEWGGKKKCCRELNENIPLSLFLSLALLPFWTVYLRDCFSLWREGRASEEPPSLHAWRFMFKHAYWWKVDTSFLLHLLNKLVVLPMQGSRLFIVLHQSVNLHTAAEASTFAALLCTLRAEFLKAPMWLAVKSVAP